jgi:hypothetical protein
LGESAFYPILNSKDETIIKALEVMQWKNYWKNIAQATRLY